MNLEKIVHNAIWHKPPEAILDYCGKYYSPYYNLAYQLSEWFDDGTYVELGVHVGRFLYSLSLGSRKARILGFDNHLTKEAELLHLKFSNVIVFNRPSLPVYVEEIRGDINILHIDTEHSYAMAKAEFEAYRPFLNDGAIVCFDDLHAMNGEVKEYFDTLDYEKIESDVLHDCGYGILIYKKETDE